ncbi:hypothetical protein CERSUDRAFT_84273 [Gelatoporia subvermispora B]|uniref:Uncharacterized protein n=1 Tax=Ceriporiopsis subvermispora (strain B) TaxID=914234 RepID=M2QGM2_CERS8|nr:hypothetical protein CERSUDRAFT_84273 [Gelatoporia subvermispora B]
MASTLDYLRPSTPYLSMTMMLSVYVEQHVLPEAKATSKHVLRLTSPTLDLSESAKAFLSDEITQDPGELRCRIFDIQKDAFEVHPEPYIQAFRFLETTMSQMPVYPTVLHAGLSGSTLFLDLGCCMGTDARKLVYDGYPASNVFACDISPRFIDLGHKLFGDTSTCPIRFLVSDILDVPVQFSRHRAGIPKGPVARLELLAGSLNHIYAGALFDLFDEPTQKDIALKILALLRREKGAIIFGYQEGRKEELQHSISRAQFIHSPASWAQLWRDVFVEVEGEEYADTRVSIATSITECTAASASQPLQQGHALHWDQRTAA